MAFSMTVYCTNRLVVQNVSLTEYELQSICFPLECFVANFCHSSASPRMNLLTLVYSDFEGFLSFRSGQGRDNCLVYYFVT